MDIWVEVTWDNGIDGDDVIKIGEVEGNTEYEIINEAKRYFGGDVSIIKIGNHKYLKTKRGNVYFWLDEER